MAEPNRPEGVPGDARWVDQDQEWELGPRDEQGNKHGEFRWWRADGTLCAESVLVHGVEDGPYRRFHENGEVSQQGTVVQEQRHGICSWQRSAEPTTELTIPPGVSDKVWRIECDFNMGVVTAKRLFDRQQHEVDASGEPMVQRPPGVPGEAQFMPRKKRWYLGEHQEETPLGLWRQWSADGEPFVEIHYRDGVGHPGELEGVPPEAVWNDDEEEWEQGQRDDSGTMVGQWRWWRPGGELVCCSSFNHRGKLHGPFSRFHPDGSRSREGTYEGGQEHGNTTYLATHGETAEYFPAAAPVWRVERDYDRGTARQTRYFLEQGAECNSRGVPLDQAYFDERFTDADPETFLDGGFESFLSQSGLIKADIASVPGINRFAELWGKPMPAELRHALGLMARTNWADLYEWRTEPVGFPVGEGENSLEQIIASDQQNYLGTELSDLFAGTMFIGSLGNGDTYHFGLYDDLHLPRGQVYFHDHETAELQDPVACDLSSFCFLVALCHAFEELESVSPAGFGAAFQKLEQRVAVPWHFRDLQQLHAGIQGKQFDYASSQQQSRLWFYRSAWIRYLLRNDGVVDVDDMPDVFHQQFNPRLDHQLHEQFLENASRYVPTALYLLFRYFFFDNQQRLAETVAACAESPSRLIRDAAALVQQLQDGRRELGSVEDIQALRRRFQELDLDPDRATEREQERRQAEAAQAHQRQLSSRRVQRWVERGDDLEQLAWNDLDNHDQHALIFEAWRSLPEMAETLAALDWIRARGYERDDLSLEHELEEAALFLATTGDRRVVPLLVGQLLTAGDQTYHAGRVLERMAGEGPAGLDPRAIEALDPLLELEEKYERRRTAAVRILARAGQRDCVPRLCQILASRRLDGDYTERIQSEELVRAILRALGQLGDPAAGEALQRCLQEESSGYDKVRAVAARALGRLGCADALGVIIDQLGDEPAPEMLWALGQLYHGADEQQQLRARAALARHRDAGELTLRLVAQAACRLVGEPVPELEQTVEQALGQAARGSDESRERKIWCMRTVAEHQLPLELARAQVHTDDHEVRAAAQEALARRGAELPELRCCHRFVLDRLLREGGLEALHRALEDPHALFRYNVALRLAELGDSSSVEVLARAVRARICTIDAGQAGDTPHDLHWMVKSLASFNHPQGNRTLADCLAHPSRLVRDPVLRHPPPDEQLVPAMVQLLDDDFTWMRNAAEQFLEPFKETETYSEAMASWRAANHQDQPGAEPPGDGTP